MDLVNDPIKVSTTKCQQFQQVVALLPEWVNTGLKTIVSLHLCLQLESAPSLAL